MTNQNTIKKNRPIIVSIVTVVFNGEHIIGSTIDSVKNQTYPHKEYIIIDGGSVDNTCSIIEKHQESVHHYVSEPDSGIYDAMNKGTQYCTGDWIIFMNAGDTFYESNTLEKFVNYINSSTTPNTELVYGDVWLISANGQEQLRTLSDSYSFLINNMVCHQCIFYSKKVMNTIGLFDTQFRYIADFDHFMRIKEMKIDIQKIKSPIARYKLDGISAQKENIKKIWKERMLVFKKNNQFSFFTRLLFWSYARLAYEFRRHF